MERRKQKLIGLLLLVNLCFIWGNSLLSPPASNAVSDKVTEVIQTVLAGTEESDPILSESWWTSAHVRKLAHAAGFSVLGVLTSAYAAVCGKRLRSSWTAIALFGVLAALIDSGGFALGMLLTVLALFRARKARARGRASGGSRPPDTSSGAGT